jgi:oligopeptide transport system ATP-binding protein
MSLLNVENLEVSFVTRNGTSKAVKGVSFTVEPKQITAIIGESGSGKSVSCYALLGLIPSPPGRIDGGVASFEGRNLLALSEVELRKIRGSDIAMIFQDPMTCLNPYLTIGEQLIEPLLIHRNLSRADAKTRAIELLNEVGIRSPDSTFDSFPHEFSGGMRQRVMIAMALINEPKLLIADEPTTALDVTIQAQILRLIADLQKHRDIGVLFISHDLAVVSDIADQIVVMEQGEVVESGEAKDDTLINVRNLRTWFQASSDSEPVKAVDDVSFDIHRGEILGLVGESGSGKSTLGRSIMRLAPITSGEVTFDEMNLTALAGRHLKNFRSRMQMIFQDPFASLNPRMTVYDTLAEPLLLHNICQRANLDQHIAKLMDDVGLARNFIRKYPHEFSGGQRQRIAIGRALATRPEFIVADEPVSALDVTIQAQILDLLMALGREHNLTMLFVSHDMAVIRHIADRVLVMYQGKVVEAGPVTQVFNQPQAPYTQSLLASIPGAAML